MAAVALELEEPTETAIETLFRPTNRGRDIIRERSGDASYVLPESLTEVELVPHQSLEGVVATGVTWEDLRHFDRNKILWMTPDVCIGPWNQNYGASLRPLVLFLGHEEGTGSDLLVFVAEGTNAATATATGWSRRTGTPRSSACASPG